MSWIVDYFKYTWQDFKRQKEVKKRYYHDPEFSKVDRALLSFYFFHSPYQVSKRYQKRRREKDIHVYGETPLKTLEKIGKELDLGPSDSVLELGCGRGRSVFFLHHLFDCQVIGIERIPHFVKLANHIAKKYEVEGVSFQCLDMLDVHGLDHVTAIYLFGTGLKDQDIQKLLVPLKTCKKGTRIVTISYPLTDYDTEGAFQLKKSFPVSFPWGDTDAYVQIVR